MTLYNKVYKNSPFLKDLFFLPLWLATKSLPLLSGQLMSKEVEPEAQHFLEATLTKKRKKDVNAGVTGLNEFPRPLKGFQGFCRFFHFSNMIFFFF